MFQHTEANCKLSLASDGISSQTKINTTLLCPYNEFLCLHFNENSFWSFIFSWFSIHFMYIIFFLFWKSSKIFQLFFIEEFTRKPAVLGYLAKQCHRYRCRKNDKFVTNRPYEDDAEAFKSLQVHHKTFTNQSGH